MGKLKTGKEMLPVKTLLNTVLSQGFQHHYPIVAGNVEDELREIMAWLNIEPVSWMPSGKAKGW